MMLSFFSDKVPSILIADDDEVVRLFLRQFLESENFSVTDVVDGLEALRKVRKNHYDLILLDIAMPGLDGLQTCEKINKTIENPPPVLIITALDDDESVDRSFHAGAIDYIRKPIHWAVLRNRIKYILEAHNSQRELERMSENYEMILDTAGNGICGLDANKCISYINPAALTMLGYQREEVLGQTYSDIFRVSMPGTDDFNVDCCPFFSDKARSKSSFKYDELRFLKKNGKSFPVDCRATPIYAGNKICGGVLVFQDVTERQQAANLIRYMANHDSLTNLPNRNYFRKRLPQAISLAERHNRMLCLLFIDLDRFKPVNDTYGHAVGDIVLKQVAERLTVMLRSSDSICRLGGDEFVILLESSSSAAGCARVAEKAIKLLNQPIKVGEIVCSIGASIGVSIYPDNCKDSETMLRQADIAMYQAKRKGRNCFAFYHESLGE